MKNPPNTLIELIGRAACRVGLLAGAAGLIGCGSLDSSGKPTVRGNLLDLRISEIHYHPLDEDTVPGDQYEFIEIRNTGSTPVDLKRVGFADGIEYAFPDTASVEAGGFLVLAANPTRFRERYGFAPFGAYSGGLNNGGEMIAIKDLPADSVIAAAAYSDDPPWPAFADGGGYSLVPVGNGPPNAPASWRASSQVHGSPGRDDRLGVLVNEVSTHTDPPARDAVELYNPGDAAVDIGGWFLSDDPEVPAKFRIPAGTSVPAKGYLVFDESDFNANPSSPAAFSLDAHGEEVWLFADSAGCRKDFCHGFRFGEIENGVTFGRYVAANGEERFPAQKEATLGAANAGPRVGPVVISEVMYRPANETDEYLELANVSTDSVPLFDPANPTHAWKVKGVGFDFPAGVTLAPGEVVLLISSLLTDSAWRAAYKVPDSVRVFRKTGGLSNALDSLAVTRPGEPFLDGGVSVVPQVVVDEVFYTDHSPWPSEPDGLGLALGRTNLGAYGNDAGNWKAVLPGPGKIP